MRNEWERMTDQQIIPILYQDLDAGLAAVIENRLYASNKASVKEPYLSSYETVANNIFNVSGGVIEAPEKKKSLASMTIGEASKSLAIMFAWVVCLPLVITGLPGYWLFNIVNNPPFDQPLPDHLAGNIVYPAFIVIFLMLLASGPYWLCTHKNLFDLL